MPVYLIHAPFRGWERVVVGASRGAARIGRNIALRALADEMPAAVISGLLGLNLQLATT